MSNNLHIDPIELMLLCTVPRIGSQRVRNLVARFKTPERVFKAAIRELIQVEGIDTKLAYHIKKDANFGFVENQKRLLNICPAHILSYWDSHYPALLKRIPDPPIILYVLGQLDCLSDAGIAIVGTRYPSVYAKLMADKFSRELTKQGLIIVSGLARGIDTISHSAVISENGKTIAVLGSGVDTIYPEENLLLSKHIIENGALISEFPLGSKPDAPHFPRRNRIIAGLTYATLVIEAGNKSGALITADFALDQGRDVFAVPGNINNPKSIGCNRLIQQGAKVVLSIDDILEELKLNLEHKYVSAVSVPPFLNKQEEKIYTSLSQDPVHIDHISRCVQMPTSIVSGILLNLELNGIVQQLAGKMFVRCK